MFSPTVYVLPTHICKEEKNKSSCGNRKKTHKMWAQKAIEPREGLTELFSLNSLSLPHISGKTKISSRHAIQFPKFLSWKNVTHSRSRQGTLLLLRVSVHIFFLEKYGYELVQQQQQQKEKVPLFHENEKFYFHCRFISFREKGFFF